MKKALIRLEDVGPGSFYSVEENLIKLRAIGDYLQSEGIPYHISLIPRYVKPSINWDKSIADTHDPYVKKFNDTIQYLDNYKGCCLGMHGYTHQYGKEESAIGYEFAYPGGKKNCPPDDPEEAWFERKAFEDSYASSRIKQGFETYARSGLKIEWGFSTPHYLASVNQRSILESWCGLFFENDPRLPGYPRTLSIRDTDMPFYRGVVYVPTPLSYVEYYNQDADIERICNEIKKYTSNELAAFYFHPYLEFPFIHITKSGIAYEDNSCLKRLIRCFKDQGFTFVSLLSLIDFVPSGRKTNFFPGSNNKLFTGNIDNKDGTNLIIWQPETGSWYWSFANLGKFPSRQSGTGISKPHLALSDWAAGLLWSPLIGDFDGNGNDDVVVWDLFEGDWYVALSDGESFIPQCGTGDYTWLKSWAVGPYWVPLVGDFNGDGKDDVIVWDLFEGDWYVALSDGEGFIPDKGLGNYKWLKSWAKGFHLIPLVGDFNSDGKDDVAFWDPLQGNWQVALSDGSRFIPQPGPEDSCWLKSWAVGDKWQALVGDFNGDGIDDILVIDVSKGEWNVALSNGFQFRPTGNSFKPWAAGKDMQPFVGDFNGNGKTDILARHPELRNGTVDIAESII